MPWYYDSALEDDVFVPETEEEAKKRRQSTGLGVVGEGHHLACPHYPVAKMYNDKHKMLPLKYIEEMEHNQKIASCCRHPENHMVSAWYSSDADKERGVPDIYKFHCTCGRTHVRFCIGGGDVRPFWEVR